MQQYSANDIPKTNYSKYLGIILILILVFMIAPRSNESALVAGANAEKNTSDSLPKELDQVENFIELLPGSKPPLIYSKQYLLLDGKTAEVIVAKDPDLPIPIASTTKMTTALIAINKLPVSKIVTISQKPPNIQGSKIGLRAGEKTTVENLLRGLLIYSGNDAAFALAEAYADSSGEYRQFVQAMNDFALENHLVNTRYGDPAGLDDETGRSTSRELANVARLLLQNPLLAEIVATPETTISSVDGQIVHRLINTNRLIQTDSTYYLPNAIGIKTGFTLDAGHSLVAAYRWQNRILIGVVMNTIESTNTASAVEMNKLFRWADNSLVLTNY